MLDLKNKYQVKDEERVLDVGGSSACKHNLVVDTIIDLLPPENAPYKETRDGEINYKKFTALDLEKDLFPFKDDDFDFCICSHTLEDLRNPYLALTEMSRVAKRGVIITPSRGREIAFSRIDSTDWLLGATRTPGWGHHNWFFESSDNKLKITPKNYAILLSPKMQVVAWSGDAECEYYWKRQIDFTIWNNTNFHKLINNYQEFLASNKDKIKLGRVAFFIDHPRAIVKDWLKLLLKRGNGFKQSTKD